MLRNEPFKFCFHFLFEQHFLLDECIGTTTISRVLDTPYRNHFHHINNSHFKLASWCSWTDINTQPMSSHCVPFPGAETADEGMTAGTADAKIGESKPFLQFATIHVQNKHKQFKKLTLMC